MPKPLEPELNRDDERPYEAPAITELGAVDDFTQGVQDESSVTDG